MADEIMEEDLLRTLEEVDVKLQNFRRKVRALLTEIQSKGRQAPPSKNRSDAS